MIEHVFVLMLENRSFDHMLGWSRLTGTDARSGEATEVDGLDGSEWNPLPDGSRVTVSAGADYALSVDPGHGFDDVLEQLCGRGARYPDAGGGYPAISNSGFASRLADHIRKSGSHADPGIVMCGFRPEQLPVLHALASEFALCDHWFSSMPGPTWPNRLFVHAATSGGLDDSPPATRSATALLRGYEFQHGTIFDRLEQAQRSWLVVEGDALPQSLAIGGMVERVLQGRFITHEQLAERLQGPELPESYVFIEPHYGHVLADGASFRCGNSQHPLDDVTRGERLLKDVYEMIRRSPHWDRSLLVVLYDEHGGFYDHVAPPVTVPPGDKVQGGNSRHRFRFDRLGVRVPALVVSPHTAGGLIDHTVYDHASLLATLEKVWGLEPLTRRDAGAAPFDHLLALPQPREDAPMVLPEPPPSGIPDCDDSLLHRLAGELEELPSQLSGPLESTLVGFLQVAIARELHLAAAVHRDVSRAVEEEQDRLLTLYHDIRNKFDGARYLHTVASRYRAHRGGAR